MPSKTKEAGVSPGCTRLEINIVGFSNLKGRLFFSSVSEYSGKRPYITSSLSSHMLFLPVNVSNSMGRLSRE